MVYVEGALINAVFARLRLIREDDGSQKPLDLLASDLIILLEIKPDGKVRLAV